MKMDLFSAGNLGSIELNNRIVMAPLTRNRAGENGVPQSINVTYYEQRATAGLIVTEATPFQRWRTVILHCLVFIRMNKSQVGKK